MEPEPRPLGQVGQTDELTVSELILGDELREWSIRYCMYLGDGAPCQPACHSAWADGSPAPRTQGCRTPKSRRPSRRWTCADEFHHADGRDGAAGTLTNPRTHRSTE